jgi:ABC-type glycerol-3-phosphate transport system permease component
MVFRQQHHYLGHFWLQMWNSVLIAVAVGAITLFIATSAAFAISRLRVKGGRTIMNLALFTYFIPAAFLAVPMYKTMSNYGLLNTQWALILAMVTIATPYSIWVLKQASDKLPLELDEAARIDGADWFTRLRHVTLPAIAPTVLLVSVLTVAGMFQLFAEPYVMTQGGPAQSTVTILYFMYEEGFKWWNLGSGAAVAFLLFLCILAVTLVQLRLAKRSGAI